MQVMGSGTHERFARKPHGFRYGSNRLQAGSYLPEGNAGEVYADRAAVFDNIAFSAIPEPATWATLAGTAAAHRATWITSATPDAPGLRLASPAPPNTPSPA